MEQKWKDESQKKVILKVDGQTPENGTEPFVPKKGIEITQVESDLRNGKQELVRLKRVERPNEKGQPNEQAQGDQIGGIKPENSLQQELRIMAQLIAGPIHRPGQNESRNHKENVNSQVAESSGFLHPAVREKGLKMGPALSEVIPADGKRGQTA